MLNSDDCRELAHWIRGRMNSSMVKDDKEFQRLKQWAIELSKQAKKLEKMENEELWTI